MSKTTHHDLVNLSGYWAYQIQINDTLQKENKILPGTDYSVLNYIEDRSTGLNAAVSVKKALTM